MIPESTRDGSLKYYLSLVGHDDPDLHDAGWSVETRTWETNDNHGNPIGHGMMTIHLPSRMMINSQRKYQRALNVLNDLIKKYGSEFKVRIGQGTTGDQIVVYFSPAAGFRPSAGRIQDEMDKYAETMGQQLG